MRSIRGVQTVALFEATKGALVLLAGCGVLALLHPNALCVVHRLLRHFSLNQANHPARLLIRLAEQVTPLHLWLLAIGALCYALLRFVEAYGLWCDCVWAEWFSVLSSGIYIPVEIAKLIKAVTWPSALLLVCNVAIVLYLATVLVRHSAKSRP